MFINTFGKMKRSIIRIRGKGSEMEKSTILGRVDMRSFEGYTTADVLIFKIK